MKHLLTLKDEGHFQYIGLSEVSAKTIVSRFLPVFSCSPRNEGTCGQGGNDRGC
jgi:hypothetical protein